MKFISARPGAWMLLAGVLGSAAPALSQANTLSIDINAIASSGEFLDAGNTVLTYNIGANSVIKSVTYDVVLEAFSPSWLSEMGAAMTDSSTLNGFLLRPAFGTNAAGLSTFAGTVDLTASGLGFAVGQDGLLRVEFAEDASDGLRPDGLWRSGTISVEFAAAVPEPETYALMALGLAGVFVAARRRPQARA